MLAQPIRIYRGVAKADGKPSSNAMHGPGYYYSFEPQTAKRYAAARGEGATVEYGFADLSRKTLLNLEEIDRSTPQFKSLVKALGLPEDAGARQIYNKVKALYPTDGMFPAAKLGELANKAGYDGIVSNVGESGDIPAHSQVMLFNRPELSLNDTKATAPVAEQPKKEAKPAKPREKKPDATTGEPYQVALARRRVDNPKTNRSRYIEAVRVLDQYENDQKLANYDKTADLDKSSDEAITDFLDAHSKRPEYEVTKAESDYAESVSEYAAERFGSETGQRGDVLADMRDLAKKGIALPVLPKWMKVESGRTFADILAGKMPGVLAYPPLLRADPKRARTDGEYRKDIKMQFEGIVQDYAQSLADLGWTQVEPEKHGWDEVVDLVSRASNGEKLVPQGGVQSFRSAKEGNPRAYSTGPNANVNPDANQQADEEMDTREPEPSPEQVAESVAIEAEYNDPRFDAEPTPAEQAVLDAKADQSILDEAPMQAVEDGKATKDGIIEAMDKAAKEALDPKNLREGFSSFPKLAAALTWVTAREIQKGLTNFAQWSVEKAKQFPSLKGSLKSIWERAQLIAKHPFDYLFFRALNNKASKAWQNVARNKQSKTLREFANLMFAKGGPDADAVEDDVPNRIDNAIRQYENFYQEFIVEPFAAEFADMKPEQRRQWDADFIDMVEGYKEAPDAKTAKAVTDYRRMMKKLFGYQTEAGVTMGDQGENYFPRQSDADAVEARRDAFLKVAEQMYRKRESRLLKKAIADVRKEQESRPDERRTADKKFERKEKTDAEYQQEAAEWANEKIAALEAEHAAKDDAYYKEKAENWATGITDGDVLDLTLFKASSGKVKADSSDARTFTKEEARLAQDFRSKDVDAITTGYIHGAIRAAELALHILHGHSIHHSASGVNYLLKTKLY